MSVQVSYKKQFVVGILLLIVILLVIEGVLRIYDYFYSYCGLRNIEDDYLDYQTKVKMCDSFLNLAWGYDKETGLYMQIPNQHQPVININSHGFRGSEIQKEKPSDVYRIFVVGGSTTFSIRAASDELTHPGMLQTRINNANLVMKVEVVNAGVIKFTTSQELILIKKRIIEFDPDLIIMYDGVNDLKKPFKFIPGERSSITQLSNFFNRYLSFWETVPVIYHAFSVKKSNTEKIFFEEEEIKNKVVLWKDNLIQICEFGNKHGYETLVILQPILGTGNKPMTEFEKNLFEIFKDSHIHNFYQLYANELVDLENYCTTTSDFRNIFDSSKHSVSNQ